MAQILSASLPITDASVNRRNNADRIMSHSFTSPRHGPSCGCCPYGYHIDLDFVRYCEVLTQEPKEPGASQSQRQRRDRRRQRRSMEVMLGFEQIVEMQQAQVHSPLYEVNDGEMEESIHNNCKFPEESYPNRRSLDRTLSWTSSQGDSLQSPYLHPKPPRSRNVPRDTYKSVIEEMDACLSAQHTPSDNHLNQSPDTQHYHRNNEAHHHQPHSAVYEQHVRRSPHSSGTESTVPSSFANSHTITDLDVDHESITSNGSDISTGALENIRDRMVKSLRLISELEKQVHTVPELWKQVNELRSDNEYLSGLIKRNEENKHRATLGDDQQPADVFKKKGPAPLPPQRRAASVGLSVPNEKGIAAEYLNRISPVPPKRSTRSPAVVTRDIGVTTHKTLTHSRGTSSDTRMYTAEELDAVVQQVIAKQNEVRTNRRVNSSTQLGTSVFLTKPSRSTSAQTKPAFTSNSVATMTVLDNLKPAELHCPQCIDRQQFDKAFIPAPVISLEFMDVLPPAGKHKTTNQSNQTPTLASKHIAIQATPPIKTHCSKATQSSPTIGINFGCQHSPPTPSLKHKQTETLDLLVLHHKLTGPDQPTSTRTRVNDRSTNTLPPPQTAQVATSTEQPRLCDVGSVTDTVYPSDSSQIQFHCSNGCPNDSVYCDACKHAIRSISREIGLNYTTSLQKSGSSHSLSGSSPVSEYSRIPRPTTLMSPRPERRIDRRTPTYNVPPRIATTPSRGSGSGSEMDEDFVKACPAEEILRRLANSSSELSKDKESDFKQELPTPSTSPIVPLAIPNDTTESTINAEDTYAQTESRLRMPLLPRLEDICQPSKPRTKISPSSGARAALKVINDALHQLHHKSATKRNPSSPASNFDNATRSANQVVQTEWFQVSSTERANPLDVEDYLDCFEEFSNDLMRYVVNMTDTNGNTAMHYAVSHGNFDIVSILLDSKFCDVNKTNNAGYTCVMLVSLAKLKDVAHHTVVKHLFKMSDVNIRAKKHSQTALMLAVSHGNTDMVKMLLAAGADINIQDEDGSTALMCAAEHGRIDIVKMLLTHTDCDSTVQDMDGSTALKISLEAGHRDIGVLLYAHEHITRAKSSNYTSLPRKKKPNKPMLAINKDGTKLVASGSASMPSSPMPSTKFRHTEKPLKD